MSDPTAFDEELVRTICIAERSYFYRMHLTCDDFALQREKEEQP